MACDQLMAIILFTAKLDIKNPSSPVLIWQKCLGPSCSRTTLYHLRRCYLSLSSFIFMLPSILQHLLENVWMQQNKMEEAFITIFEALESNIKNLGSPFRII